MERMLEVLRRLPLTYCQSLRADAGRVRGVEDLRRIGTVSRAGRIQTSRSRDLGAAWTRARKSAAGKLMLGPTWARRIPRERTPAALTNCLTMAVEGWTRPDTAVLPLGRKLPSVLWPRRVRT